MPRIMSLRNHALLISLTLAAVACSGGADEAPPPARPTVASTTSTSLAATTTTEAAHISIDGAPEGLVSLVDDFYSYASDPVGEPPPMPSAVLDSMGAASTATHLEGSVALGSFHEEEVGVVQTGGDTFLVIDDGSGWRIVGGDWPSISVPPYFGATPRHVAVVGSDARPGQDMDRTRADSIHFVALDGEGGGAIVGLPRDSYVPVPGHGTKKVTASLALGGPDTMMATFDELTGLPLEGYVLTGFAGFEELAGSVLGGVQVDVPIDINDKWAKVTLRAGQQILDGAQALGFARARKTVGGDLVRSGHQGIILLGAAKMVQAMGYESIPGLLEMSEPYLMTNLTPEQILTFSAMVISSDLDEIPNVVAPGRSGTAAGASVVFLSDSVSELWADLADAHLEDE
jgi:polyisoprenyl-teichoic acid--peptidoglycan teichoic acid transferase